MGDSSLTAPAHGCHRILGFDPGTSVTGWGVVDRQGNRYQSAGYGTLRPVKGESRETRLAWLQDEAETLIQRASPHRIALEQAFLGKNIQSALRLGEARGALLAAAGRRGVEVVEYPTATVKKAIAGNGRADKQQLQFMLQRLLGLADPPKPLDASDALALALALALDFNLRERSVQLRDQRGP
ncbi:MAG: crossover junction endodeoxyribonuclease RuvC [Planctomycetes bacterium]|nr:crossover junction endodeoxyribonuclease RuvC [Planctomycetota bacterium]